MSGVVVEERKWKGSGPFLLLYCCTKHGVSFVEKDSWPCRRETEKPSLRIRGNVIDIICLLTTSFVGLSIVGKKLCLVRSNEKYFH